MRVDGKRNSKRKYGTGLQGGREKRKAVISPWIEKKSSIGKGARPIVVEKKKKKPTGAEAEALMIM